MPILFPTVSKKRTDPRDGSAGRDIENQVADMRFFIVSKRLRPDGALYLRVKMRKEIRAAEQIPIKKEDIVDYDIVEALSMENSIDLDMYKMAMEISI